MVLPLFALRQYDCYSEAIHIVIIHGESERQKARIVDDTFVVFGECSRTFVSHLLRLAQCLTTANAVVGNDDTARVGEAERPVEVLRVGGLICINENEIERTFLF